MSRHDNTPFGTSNREWDSWPTIYGGPLEILSRGPRVPSYATVLILYLKGHNVPYNGWPQCPLYWVTTLIYYYEACNSPKRLWSLHGQPYHTHHSSTRLLPCSEQLSPSVSQPLGNSLVFCVFHQKMFALKEAISLKFHNQCTSRRRSIAYQMLSQEIDMQSCQSDPFYQSSRHAPVEGVAFIGWSSGVIRGTDCLVSLNYETFRVSAKTMHHLKIKNPKIPRIL